MSESRHPESPDRSAKRERVRIDLGPFGINKLTSEEMARRISVGVQRAHRVTVQFDHEPSAEQLSVLATAINQSPNAIEVRLYGGDGGGPTLPWLDGLSGARHLAVEGFNVASFDALERFTELRSLSLGQTRSGLPSLECVGNMPRLTVLAVEGHHRGAEAIAKLSDLKMLNLRTVRGADFLERIGEAPRLEALRIWFGAIRSYGILERFAGLRAVEIGFVSKLEDDALEPIGRLVRLRELSLADLPRITRLPAFAQDSQLRRVVISGLKSLHSVSSLLDLEHLQTLQLESGSELAAGQVDALAATPGLLHLFIRAKVPAADIETAVKVFNGITFKSDDRSIHKNAHVDLDSLEPHRLLWPPSISTWQI